MSAWHLLDSELLPLFKASPGPVLSAESLPMMRGAMAAARGTARARSTDDVAIEESWIDTSHNGPLRILLFRPKSFDGLVPGMVHFHPGGWVLGVPELSTSTLLAIASVLKCVIVSVDYRLAPEHPFPAAHDDGLAALQWLVRNADDLGIDRDRLGLLGESAGATIATGLALYLRDEAEQNPLAFLSLVYPALDDQQAIAPPHPFAGTIGLDQNAARFAWQALLGQEPGGEHVSCLAAPARATELGNLPPTFMAIGSLDPFIEENFAFAQRLIRAGVRTELYVIDGAPHGFDRAETAEVTRNLHRVRNSWLLRILGKVPQ